MALNPASHNPTGEKTGAVSGQPPPLSSEVTDDIKSSSEADLEGTSVPGQDSVAASKPLGNESKDGKEEG